MDLKPFDIVVIDGLWYMPHHWLIRWRGLDKGVHCATVINEQGDIWNPLFTGIREENINKYKGRYVTIHRLKGLIERQDLVTWGNVTSDKSTGYDFFRQWLLGFVCGMASNSLVNDETKWTCAEFPYWGLQDNGYQITTKEESLPMPRLFRYHKDFKTIFEGVL